MLNSKSRDYIFLRPKNFLVRLGGGCPRGVSLFNCVAWATGGFCQLQQYTTTRLLSLKPAFLKPSISMTLENNTYNLVASSCWNRRAHAPEHHFRLRKTIMSRSNQAPRASMFDFLLLTSHKPWNHRGRKHVFLPRYMFAACQLHFRKFSDLLLQYLLLWVCMITLQVLLCWHGVRSVHRGCVVEQHGIRTCRLSSFYHVSARPHCVLPSSWRLVRRSHRTGLPIIE